MTYWWLIAAIWRAGVFVSVPVIAVAALNWQLRYEGGGWMPLFALIYIPVQTAFACWYISEPWRVRKSSGFVRPKDGGEAR